MSNIQINLKLIAKYGVAIHIFAIFVDNDFVKLHPKILVMSFYSFVASPAGAAVAEDIAKKAEKVSDFYDKLPAMGLTFDAVIIIALLIGGLWVINSKRVSGIIDKMPQLLTSVAVLVLVAGIALYSVGYYDATAGASWISRMLIVVPRSIISSFKMFVVSNELARVEPALRHDTLYMILFSLTHFAAALVSFYFVFRMIGYKIKANIRLSMLRVRGRQLHIFWGVNEASLTLAESIQKGDDKGKYAIIFIDINHHNEDSQKAMSLSRMANTFSLSHTHTKRIDNIGAYITSCPRRIEALKTEDVADVFKILGLRSIGNKIDRCDRVNFYLLSEDEDSNIISALNLQKDIRLNRVGAHQKMKIYTHVRNSDKNEIYDNYSLYNTAAETVDIKLIDSSYLSVLTLKLHYNSLPVSTVKVDPQTATVEDNEFEALIVGFGETGQEAFNFLYEYSSFIKRDGTPLQFRCCAFDTRMKSIEGTILTQMPNIQRRGILTLKNASADSNEFWEYMSENIHKLNYIVIAILDDDMSMSLAVNIHKYIISHRVDGDKPIKIAVRCYNREKHTQMSDVVNMLNKSAAVHGCEIILFGNINDIYTNELIVEDFVLSRAQQYHYIYENGSDNATTLTSDDIQTFWRGSFSAQNIALKQLEGLSRFVNINDMVRRIDENISNTLHMNTKMALMGIRAFSMEELWGSVAAELNAEREQRVIAERKEYIERAIAEPKKEYDAKPTPERKKILKDAKKQAQKEALQSIVLIPATGAEIREECERRIKTYRSLLEELNDIVATRRDKTIGYDGSGNEARGEAYKTLLMNLALTEHQRWVASHELRGFSLAERTDIQHKLHRCICAWEELDCECTKSYDCNVVDTSIRLFLQSEFLKGGK